MTPGRRPRAVFRRAVRTAATTVPAPFLAVVLAAALLASSPTLESDNAAPSGPVLLAPSAERAPVTPDVEEVPVEGTPRAALAVEGAEEERGGQPLAALSKAEDVDGYAVTGVTWEPETAPEEMAVEVRTLDGEAWSEWEEVEVHDDHGPDPDSAEARNARAGSDPIVIGDVDEVQTRVISPDGEAPEDVQMAVIESDPVKADAATEPAAIEGELSNVAATSAPRPQIFSRKQWGADERLRSGSPSYGKVNGGFVHHTVSASAYSRAQVPGILRGIYAYHTRSNGWSDIGYNFLVDRFGRIWEGRYGGVTRPVIGAHTYGYNHEAFAASAIGDFEETQKYGVRPTSAMVNAYGRLMAWKLAIHGVGAKQRRTIAGRSFPAISGHRDAGSTACPGSYLYAKIGAIRNKAHNRQTSAPQPPPKPKPKPITGGDAQRNLKGTTVPDLLVRDKRNGAVKVRTGDGGPSLGRQRTTARRLAGSDLIAASPDLTGDGRPDLVARVRASKKTKVFPGTAAGNFAGPGAKMGNFRWADMLTAVGDLTGDGRNDMLTRNARNGNVHVYPGNGKGRFARPRLLLRGMKSWRWMTGAGDVNGDRRPDLVVVTTSGQLRLHSGTASGRLSTTSRLIGKGWRGRDLVAGGANFGMSGKADLIVRERGTGRTWLWVLGGKGNAYARTGDWPGLEDLDRLFAVPDMTGDRQADLVGRRSDGRIVVVPGSNGRWLSGPSATGAKSSTANLLLSGGDWNGDGRDDAMTRPRDGQMQLWAGNGAGKLTAMSAQWRGWQTMKHIVPIGDVTGDDRPDLMAQDRKRHMWLYPGAARGTTGKRTQAMKTMIDADLAFAAGRWDGDTMPDLIARHKRSGALHLYASDGSGGLKAPRRIGTGYGRYDRIVGMGDVNDDGRPDLVGRERSTGFLWLLPGSAKGLGLDTRQYMATAARNLDLLG